jgi:hypothetical protein
MRSEVLAEILLTIQAFWFVRLFKDSNESRAFYFKARAVFLPCLSQQNSITTQEI